MTGLKPIFNEGAGRKPEILFVVFAVLVVFRAFPKSRKIKKLNWQLFNFAGRPNSTWWTSEVRICDGSQLSSFCFLSCHFVTVLFHNLFQVSWITRCFLTYGHNEETWQINRYTNMHLKLSPVVILSIFSFLKNLRALGIWNNIFYWPIFDLYMYSHIFQLKLLEHKSDV